MEGRVTIDRVALLPRRRWAAVLTACAVLAGALLVIRLAAPPPYRQVVSEKLDHYRRHRGDIDVLFLGSSQTYRHVSPADFDAVTAAAGVPTRSFNLGAPMMSSWESLQLLETMGRRGSGELKWVILDTGFPTPSTWPWLLKTQRNIHWHGPRATWQVTRAWAAQGLGTEEIREIYYHLVAFAYNFGNIGRLSHLVFPSPLEDAASLGPAGDGWDPLDPVRFPERAEAFQKKSVTYDRLVRELIEARETRPPLDPRVQNVLARLEAAVRALGAEPIFVSPPGIRPHLHLREAESLGVIERHWSFQDPRRFPELYRFSARFDRGHLTTETSRRYSRMLAERFIEVVAAAE